MAFRLAAPAATVVAVAGDFNGWRPDALTMTRTPDGEWLARADLPPGRYAYMYVVDGQWTTPPDAPRTQDDGFGSTNAIIDVL
ncbi:MAG: glycogen-binding domain-containing protein [bacterium]